MSKSGRVLGVVVALAAVAAAGYYVILPGLGLRSPSSNLTYAEKVERGKAAYEASRQKWHVNETKSEMDDTRKTDLDVRSAEDSLMSISCQHDQGSAVTVTVYDRRLYPRQLDLYKEGYAVDRRYDDAPPILFSKWESGKGYLEFPRTDASITDLLAAHKLLLQINGGGDLVVLHFNLDGLADAIKDGAESCVNLKQYAK